MKALYEQHMADLYAPAATVRGGRPLPQAGIEHYSGFVREAANEIDVMFPRLPNPFTTLGECAKKAPVFVPKSLIPK